MKDHNRHKFKGFFRTFRHQLLTVDLYRYFRARLRFFFLVKVLRRLKTYDLETQSIAGNTISHNLKGMQDVAVIRSLAIIKPVMCIDKVGIDSKVLSIGPRTEGEIFNLIGQGFLKENITGLDLISYSSYIDLGDMHKMKYADNSFDVVIMGWVISYSETPELAAKEVVRVAKNGAIVSVGVEYGGLESKKKIEKLDCTPGAGRLTTHSQQLIDFFGESVDKIYFRHDIDEDRMDKTGSVIAVFSIKK
ncbi:MAG: methyltransferase domain-containing protein [Fluviicola sp.]